MRKTFFLVALAAMSVFSAMSQDTIVAAPAKADTLLPFQRQELKAVSVTAKKKLVEQKIDRMVVNIDAMMSAAGTSALEVLEKTPGVQVDKDGNISLKGRQGVMVMLDGRPTYLSGAELANLLRGMEASQLEQIEIMTNPPARYDAAGNTGVINIKTRKNKASGFNGSITMGATQGRYFRTNESISLNYGSTKFSVFGNYSFGTGDHFNNLDIFRRYINDDLSTRGEIEQSSSMKMYRTNNNLKLGADYRITQKTTVGIVFTGASNPTRTSGSNTSYLKDASSRVDSIIEARSRMKDHWKNGGLNINVRHKYDTTARELTADIDLIAYDVTSIQRFNNISYDPQLIKQGEDILNGELPMRINIYSAKTDYVLPVGKTIKIESGLKSSYVVTDSKANYFLEDNGSSTPDYSKTNFFRYRENINAGYVTVHKKINEKLEVQAGMRFENTNYNGLQHGNPTRPDSSFRDTYNNIFPTAFLQYKAGKEHSFGLSTGRRIDRPQYQDLNPFLFFIDRYTYGSGNPYLRPQFTNNVELSHTFRGFLTTTLNYGYTRNLITETFTQNGEYATIQSTGNLGKRQNAGISVNANFPVATWLRSNLYANYNYNILEGVINDEPIDITAGNFFMNMSNQFEFGKGWTGELSGWYRMKGIEGQIVTYPMGELNTAIAKKLWEGKGSVKLSVRDIFYTNPPRGDIRFKTTEAKFRATWDSRAATLTFTYRFGKPAKASIPQPRERFNEEQRRVGGN